MVEYLPRSAWGARPADGATSLFASNVEGYAEHWPGMTVRIDATGDIGKRRVASALRGWQNFHMDDRGWSDIAYQVAIDQAGRAWTLRGLNIRSGANGDADVNKRFGAFLLVLGPGEEPSAAMKATAKAVAADFRARFPKARAKPYGHRDVRPGGTPDEPSTDCPGDRAYDAIQRGEMTPGSSSAPGDTTPPPSKDWFDMATPKEIEDAVKAGVLGALREYGSALFKDEQGTGDTILDETRAHRATEIQLLDSIASAVAK